MEKTIVKFVSPHWMYPNLKAGSQALLSITEAKALLSDGCIIILSAEIPESPTPRQETVVPKMPFKQRLKAYLSSLRKRFALWAVQKLTKYINE